MEKCHSKCLPCSKMTEEKLLFLFGINLKWENQRRDEKQFHGRHVCERKANILRAIEKLPSSKPKRRWESTKNRRAFVCVVKERVRNSQKKRWTRDWFLPEPAVDVWQVDWMPSENTHTFSDLNKLSSISCCARALSHLLVQHTHRASDSHSGAQTKNGSFGKHDKANIYFPNFIEMAKNRKETTSKCVESVGNST